MFLFSTKSVLHKPETALEGDMVTQNGQARNIITKGICVFAFYSS